MRLFVDTSDTNELAGSQALRGKKGEYVRKQSVKNEKTKTQHIALILCISFPVVQSLPISKPSKSSMLLNTGVPVTRPVRNSIGKSLLTKKKEIANMKRKMVSSRR